MLTNINTAQEYFDYWHSKLSTTCAVNLENIKKACDAIVSIGPHNELNPKTVGNYCQHTLHVAPAKQTIRNMSIEVKGEKEYIYNTYIKKRRVEYEGKLTPFKKTGKADATFSYRELANKIKDDITRTFVQDLIQRWQHAENSYDFMAKQLENMSREVNGFNMAAAITKGPADENIHRLPLMSPIQMSSNGMPESLLSAVKAVLEIPSNQEVPFLTINGHGALVWDSGTGPVVLLGRKHWDALKNAVQGEV